MSKTKLQRSPNFPYPAGGGEPIMVPKFVHMPASEGVERLLAHPIGPKGGAGPGPDHSDAKEQPPKQAPVYPG
jgi:hypothetical protein